MQRFLYPLYFTALLIFVGAGISSCQKEMETSAPISSTQGYLLLSMDEIDVSQLTTTQSKAITTPQVSNFNLTVTSISSGQVVYSGPIPSEPLIEEVGNYTLTASYGSATSIGVNTPYFEGSTTVEIQSMTLTRASLTATLQSALIEPEIAAELASHFSSYYVEAVCGTTTTQLTPGIIGSTAGETLCVPAGSSVSCTLKGTNLLGESVSTSLGTLSAVEAATRYKVNCNASLPQFTVPAQVEGDVWSQEIYLTEMSASNISRGNSTKILEHIVYEASSDGVNWITATTSGGRKVISGLTPGTTYTLRSRFVNIPSSNTQSITTERATQLNNGDMESWSQTKLYNGNGTFSAAMYCDYLTGWNTRNEKTTSGASGANGTSNYGLNWRWCSGTVSTTDAVAGSAAEISTLAFYTKSFSGSVGSITQSNDTRRALIYSKYVQPSGVAYVGYLFTGTFDANTDSYSLGSAHTDRPHSITFSYKYAPTSGDLCCGYVKIYNSNKQEIASTTTFSSSTQSSYTTLTLPITYSNSQVKAAYIGVFFQSGTNTDISKMALSKGSYGSTPYNRDRVVGSVLKIDNVTLNY